MELRNQNFVIQLEREQMDFQPKFLVAMDSSTSSGKRLQNNEIVFLDGASNGVEEYSDGDAVNSSDSTYDDDSIEPHFFVEGDEVDLSQPDDGIVHMELAAEIDDSDEPYQDCDGALYYICEKCTFVCIDHATLVQHTNEKHPKNQPPTRPRTNNSALRSGNAANYLDDFIYNNETALSQERVTSTTLSSPPVQPTKEPSPSPPPLQPLSMSPQSLTLSTTLIEDLKPYECEICHKRLSTRANLRGHITIHSNDKPFACQVCPKRFKQKRHLKYHQKIHNFKDSSMESNLIVDPNNKLFQSQYEQGDESNGSFGLNEETIVQLQSNGKHTIGIENRPAALFRCNQCPKAYSQKCNLYRHQRSHSPIYSCDICQKKFKNEQNVHEHMKTHTLADCFSEL